MSIYVCRSKYFRLLSVTIELAKDQDQNLLSEDDDMWGVGSGSYPPIHLTLFIYHCVRHRHRQVNLETGDLEYLVKWVLYIMVHLTRYSKPPVSVTRFPRARPWKTLGGFLAPRWKSRKRRSLPGRNYLRPWKKTSKSEWK